jgi:hypothetical protein
MTYLKLSSQVINGKKIYTLADGGGAVLNVDAATVKLKMRKGDKFYGLRLSADGRLLELGKNGEFDKTQMLFLLRQVGKHLQTQGFLVNIVIYGGAAIAINCFDSRRSVDIDVVVTDGRIAPFYNAVDAIAKKYNLDKSWMNQDVGGVVSAIAKQDLRASKADFGGLSVMYPNTRQLLAMKLFAARDKDVDDAVLLARQLKIRSKDELLRVLRTYFNEDALRRRARAPHSSGVIAAMLEAVSRQLCS